MPERIRFTDKIGFIVPRHQQDRLDREVFRRGAFAGCISKWPSARAALYDPVLRRKLIVEVNAIIAETDKWVGGTYSVTVAYPEVVGWDATVTHDDARGLPTKQDSLNTYAWGDFIADKDVPAPMTRELTCVLVLREGKTGRDDVLAVVESMYPGRDVGRLKGNVSAREKVFFFHRDTPGDDVIRYYWVRRRPNAGVQSR